MKILVTGGAGFIGANFIHYFLNRYKDAQVVNLDKLTYAGNLDNLTGLEKDKRYCFIQSDICDASAVEKAMQGVEAIVNFAAESHVDRSIADPGVFLRTNVLGTQTLLEAARLRKIKRFLQISTDEVYGSLGAHGIFRETTPLDPSSPYSASKAGADLLVLSYFRTFKMPVLVTRCSNNYGPYQFPEKFIPLLITNLMEGKKIPVYGDGQNVRDWIHVEDHCRALDLVLRQGREGEVYNIGASNEWKNIDIAQKLIGLLGRDGSAIEFVADRLGHDRRYAIDPGKIQKELGWRPGRDFAQGLDQTVAWYKANQEWWQKLKKKHKRDVFVNK